MNAPLLGTPGRACWPARPKSTAWPRPATFDDADAPLSLHTVLVGELTCAREDFPAARVRQGDLVLVRGGRYRFVHEPGAAARPVAEVLAAGPAPGTPRTYVLGDGHGTELLCGAYAFDGGLWSAMVATLPAVTVVTSAGNRALRAHWTAPQAAAPDWFRALSDPVAGPALGALHEAPARSWTVGDLAVRAGVSRATLATGYADEFSFAVAFKREVGVAPGRYRARRTE